MDDLPSGNDDITFLQTWQGWFWKQTTTTAEFGPFTTRGEAEDNALEVIGAMSDDAASDFDRQFFEKNPGCFQFIRRSFPSEKILAPDGGVVVAFQVRPGFRTRLGYSAYEGFTGTPLIITDPYERAQNWDLIFNKPEGKIFLEILNKTIEDGEKALLDMEALNYFRTTRSK